MMIDNGSLTCHLPLLKGGLATRPGASIPSSFLLEGRGNHIALVSSNQFSETSCKIDATGAADGAVAIPSQFADIVEKCADAPINLKLGPKRADLVIGSTKARLQLQPGASFPRLVVGDIKTTLKIASKALKKALQETIAFAPTGHMKACLNGVLLILQPNRVTCVATNGHVMAVSSSAAELDIAAPIQRILPTACLRQLLKILDLDRDVTITDASNAMSFAGGPAVFTVKPVPERYPDWKRLMAPAPTHTVEVDKAAIVASLERSNVFADAKSPSSSFEVGTEGLQISSASKASEIGESADLVQLLNDGEIASKRFTANLAYMQEAANAINSQTVRLSYSLQDRTALWFRKSGADDYVVIISPMTV